MAQGLYPPLSMHAKKHDATGTNITVEMYLDVLGSVFFFDNMQESYVSLY